LISRGETDLAAMLSTLDAVCDAREFGFGAVADVADLPPIGATFAVIGEDEGLTVIAPIDILTAHAIPHDGGWALISLRLHSALEAVGLTATISGALARAGISANMIAGVRHDHLLVPWAKRDAAMAVLRGLSAVR
jgi:uncharacterized protein